MWRVFLPISFLIFAQANQARAYVTPHQYYDPSRKLILGVANTGWDIFSGDDTTSKTTTNDQKLQIVVRAPTVSPSGIQSTLTMRVDKGDWRSARTYAEKWLKDFPKFGFELQGAKDSKYGNLVGYDMELTSKDTQRRARQFVVRQPHEMWIFTCSADSASFQEAWKACEKILNTAMAR